MYKNESIYNDLIGVDSFKLKDIICQSIFIASKNGTYAIEDAYQDLLAYFASFPSSNRPVHSFLECLLEEEEEPPQNQR
jgi:hypothetical protein